MTRGEVAGIAAATLVLALHALPSLGTTVDDAWITARYADHLLAGHGLVYNAALPPVEGITNPAWALGVAAALAAGLPAFAALEGLGLACALALPGLAWAAARALAPAPRVHHLAAAWLVAVSPHVAVVATNGLETTAWLAGLLGVGLAVQRAGSPAGRVGAGALAGALGLLRPEGYLVGAVLVGLVLLRDRMAAAPLALTAAAAVGTTEAWRVATYGAWLPNTFAAKAGGAAEPDLAYVALDGLLWPMVWAAAGIAAAAAPRRVPAVALLLLGATLTAVALRVDLWMPGARLLLPGGLVAALLVAAAEGPVGHALRALAVLGAAALHLSSVPADARRYDRVHSVAPTSATVAAGRHLRDHLPAGSVVVARDAGLLPYTLGVGLTVVETHPRALTLPHPSGAPTELARWVPERPAVVVETVAGADEAAPRYAGDRWVRRHVRGRYVMLGRVRQHHRRHYDLRVRADLAVPPLAPGLAVETAP